MPRRYVPPRTGWASHMPNATLAVGAGLEPAQVLRRDPRLRRGAIPFRSSYRRPIWRRRSDSERMAPFEGRSALVRLLRPLGHVSTKYLVGMERFELSRAKALVSKTSVSPISTTSPSLTKSQQLSYNSSVQVPSTTPVDTNGGLPGTRTLKMSQVLRLPRLPIPPEAHKAKAPRSLEGLGGLLRTLPKSAAPLHAQQIAE